VGGKDKKESKMYTKIKPIVIVADKDGRVSMTVDEMKKLLDDAFEAGKQSGTTTINNYPYVYRRWWDDPYYTTITCGTSTSSQANITLTSSNTNQDSSD
jgi:hypothetical protein